MFRQITKWTLAGIGAGLYTYDHQNKLKHYLLSQELIKAPQHDDYPPTFEVQLKKGFEEDFDKKFAEMENTIKEFKETKLDDKKTFQGKTEKSKTGELIPTGVGTLKENQGALYTGKFDSGVMDGYVKLVTPENKVPRVEKCLYEKGNKEYSIVYHEDGVRCEGRSDCFSCVRPDGSIYSEKVDKENKIVRSFLYDSDFKLKSERTLSYPERIGEGRHFYQNGRVYIGGMNATGPYGKGVIKDQYGDIVYEGEVDNEVIDNQKTNIVRTLITLGCLLGSYLL